jgi:transposase-like protein
MKHRKHLSGEKKSIILRELLDNSVPVSQLAEQYGVHPNDILRWKKQLFENAGQLLNRKKSTKDNLLEKENKFLKAKLQKKDEVISIIAQENLELKKNIDGEL